MRWSGAVVLDVKPKSLLEPPSDLSLRWASEFLVVAKAEISLTAELLGKQKEKQRDQTLEESGRLRLSGSGIIIAIGRGGWGKGGVAEKNVGATLVRRHYDVGSTFFAYSPFLRPPFYAHKIMDCVAIGLRGNDAEAIGPENIDDFGGAPVCPPLPPPDPYTVLQIYSATNCRSRFSLVRKMACGR